MEHGQPLARYEGMTDFSKRNLDRSHLAVVVDTPSLSSSSSSGARSIGRLIAKTAMVAENSIRQSDQRETTKRPLNKFIDRFR